MVFEAVVVELLNKFLKQYIENLDTSQLKIGIWGGDVVLKDLKIKSTVFDDLQLPVRVKWGKLGKLALNIPWKNLYSAQVVVDIEELLLVVIPNSEFKYDPVKEEKWAQDRKQARLRAIEEAKKREMQTDPTKPNDGFVEKLLTQITKNLQIVIRNIHIRYEDRTTIPGSPFSVGVTLCNLSALTTLTDPTMNFSKMMKENENFICKVVNLEGLAIYWNSNSVLFSELPTSDLVNAMIKSIPRADYKPDGFMYIFGPLSASGFLRLNPKPELDGSDFKIPKIFINIHLKEIELAVTHNQFCDAMAYLEDFQRFVAATKYRKYRPVGIPVIGHAREWWHFAYAAVLEDITRRRNEWCWTYIINHRQCCRKYSELFKLKLNSKKMTADELKELAELEKKLNVFNLVLIREQVYVEAERTVKEQKSGGWFSGWFGYGSEAKSDPQDEELVKKIQSVMTKQEKQKLYKAIGYEETASPTNYPIDFVEVQFWFHLDEMKTTVYDDRTKHLVKILTLSVRSVRMEFEQRPCAFAMKFVMMIGNFQIIGKQEADASYPELVTSNCKESESLIELLYETKPLNATCDQRVIVYARPLSIIYHANTINLVREVFQTESSGEMEKIVAATSASLPTFQSITSLGLQYAIEKRTELEVKVNIMSSYLIIPYGGVYRPGKDMLVLLLGKLSVETEESDKTINVKQLHLQGTTDEEIFSTIVSASYTKFKCNLTGVQILFQLSGEDWVSASKMQRSALQFLEPTNLEVTIKKSLVMDDARIPKMIIEGKMPSLVFNFQEERFLNFVALASSIPTTSEDSVVVLKKGVTSSTWSIQSLGAQLENKLINMQKDLSAVNSTEYVQGIDLVGQFEMKELTVNISKTKGPIDDFGKLRDSKTVNYPGRKFLSLKIVQMEMEITQKTFEVIHLFKLGGIEFLQYHNRDWLPFVSTKLNRDYLFIVEFIKLDTKIPDFYTSKGGIVNRLTLNITPLKVLLEKEALLAQLEFVTNVQKRVELVRENVTGGHLADTGKGKETIFEEAPENVQPDKKVIAKGKRFRKKTTQKEVIDFFLQVSLDEIDIMVEFRSQGLTEFNLKGGSIDISTQKSYMTVDANIREIHVLDLNAKTKHPKIVASLEEQTLTSRVTLYNKEYFGSENSLDMSVEAEVGGIQCTYVTLFFSRAIEFLNAFQSQIQTFKEGASIAAQKARENVVKAFHNAAEICLKIKITAPLLLIPKTSESLETLAVDLGVLTIKNSITELDYTPEAGTARRPLIDTIKVLLDNLKMSSCTLSGPNMTPENERTFLVPVTFELNVKRNLSKSWFTVIPELEIVARLASVHVTLTHEDLCVILNVLRRNLEEGEQANMVRRRSSQGLLEPRVMNKPKGEKTVFHSDLAKDLEELTGDTCRYSTVVKFMFFMDSFVFDALHTPEKKENETGLARFVLEAMSLKGRMFSNNSLHTSVMLVSCLLDDTRPGKEGRLTRLMERTLDPTVEDAKVESNRTNSMIELIYYKKDMDCFIDLRIYKFTLILSMDFLHKLREFFTLEETSAENLRQPVMALDKHILTVAETEIEHPTFTVNVRFEKPDIIFVENMDSVNVDALIFHTEMMLKYRLAGSKQVISGTLRDIELYSCCFNPLKRPHTMNQVIKPFMVSVAGSTPEGSGLHVDICVSDIFIRIDPSTVDLISKCHEALLKDSSVNNEDEEEEDYSDLWNVKNFTSNDYWFLKPELAQDALSVLKSQPSALGFDTKNFDQICLMAIPSINILVEGVQTSRVQPLILLEMGFQMRCYNWSQRLTIMKSLTLQMKYYNNIVSDWEPVIEPVEKYTSQNKHSYIPWEINCSIACGDEGELDELRPPKVQITLSCPEILQVTVTKTCLDVLRKTINRYTTAVTKHLVKKLPDLPPYVVKNETGLVAELLLEESKLQVCRSLSENYNIVKLDSNSEVELQNIPPLQSEVNKNVSLSAIKKETMLFVKFSGMKDHSFELPLGQPSRRCYPFPAGTFKGSEPWALVSDVSVVNNSTTVILRSIFSIINYFNEPINVHSLSEDGKVAEYVGAVEGNSKFHVPFQTVYSENKKLFFSVNGYSLSMEPFDWSILKDDANSSTLLQCTSKVPENEDPFFIQAVGEAEAICHRSTNWKTGDVVYKLHLQPTVKIFNSLPHPLVICFQGSAEEKLLQPGNKLQMTNAEPGTTTVTLRLSDYLEKDWSCKETIVENPPEFFIWKFVSYNGLSPESLHLGVHVTFTKKTAVYAIYCPFFMINKTEQLLSYKFEHSSAVFHHPGDLTVPVMFSPTSKKFFNKKTASLKVGHSSWSDKFPVDVAGSGGIVECKHSLSDITYKIAVSISLTYNSLTKVVVFSPFYVMINSMEYAVEYQECDRHRKKWHEIPPRSCIPFWPRSDSKERKIQVRPQGSSAVSPPFAYHSTDVCLLRLPHKWGGIFVKIKASQSGTYITFSEYEVGQAPALVINYSDEEIPICELNTDSTVTLKPSEEVMYAWSCPTGERKLFVPGPKNTKTIIPLNEDTEGIACTEVSDRIRFVSFLDGSQRVLLFTQDLGLSRSISNIKLSSSGVELICKLQGFGFSLVNDISRVELLYLTFISSGIAWETKKSGKNFYKKMKDADAYDLENAYQKYEEEAEANTHLDSVVSVSDKFKVDFEKMKVISPFSRELRRTYEPGFWLAYRQIEDQIMLHVKINRIQVDSQLLDTVFPVILAPIPAPKTVAYQGPKPFFELSVVKIATDRSGVEQYKYFKTLIQEFHVKMDVGFIQQMYSFMTAEEMSDEQEKILFQKDLAVMQQPLKAHVEIVASHEQKNFYDLLHFSPLKIHFSFSMAGKLETNTYLPPAFSVMLQSLGVTLTDIHDVTFRLSYLERKSVFLTNRELLQEVFSHYYGQIVRQAYVLLLGLDVIGNPYGLIVGIGEGVEAFFYEPIQGMIQGPSEFGKGMAIGWKSLFDHTVGSAAGSLGKLTGTLGKGLAVLSLDKEYQMQRMVEQNQQGNLQSSMAVGGRSLVLGVLEGVSGVVQKPIRGAKEEGVGGFFKGMGKGMMGLVTRPVTGIVDFASTSLNAVKRATVIGAENKRLRSPRYFRSDTVVEPYNTEDAHGYLIFYSICRRKYCATDKYEYHSYLREKEVVLLTNKRIILAEYSEVFGAWQEHMAITWNSMPERPRCHTKGVALTMPARPGVLKKEIKVLLIDDESVREIMCKKMVQLYNLDKEQDAATVR